LDELPTVDRNRGENRAKFPAAAGWSIRHEIGDAADGIRRNRDQPPSAGTNLQLARARIPRRKKDVLDGA
jgi:hypothetical protein